MKHEGHLENNDVVVGDIGICIRLIDIFMEEDAVHNTWLERFFCATPIKEALSAGKRNLAIYSMVSLRQLKALHLYHLIRAYKLLTWWD